MSTARLAAYIRQFGPIRGVLYRPERERFYGLSWYFWATARYRIELAGDTPTLTLEGPVRYWTSLAYARKHAAELAAKEGRISLYYPPGPLDEETSRIVLGKLKAYSAYTLGRA